MNGRVYRVRRMVAVVVAAVSLVAVLLSSADLWQPVSNQQVSPEGDLTGSAAAMLETVEVKGRAPKTGYERTQFGDGWNIIDGCDTRNRILYRDLSGATISEDCKVLSGTLADPYTGKIISFKRGANTSDAVQIDHVVALSNAWQTGAQQLDSATREKLANDPLELLAVEGKANQEKSDGDAATWLPSNKMFRCQYVARQIAVKAKYRLWMTPAEKDVIERVLSTCPGQTVPSR